MSNVAALCGRGREMIMGEASIWTKEVQVQRRKEFAGRISVNTAVIGGGMAGILTACLLQEKGISCVVLEAGRMGSGQTGRTTAKVTLQHRLIYDKLIRTRGIAQAQQYADANRRAIEEYRRLIAARRIDCDWQETAAYLYTKTHVGELQRECRAAEKLGIPAEMVSRTELPFPVEGALCFAEQAQFHPLKFLRQIAPEMKLCEHSRVLRVDAQELTLENGTVKAENIVFASHYPFVNVPGYYFLKMHQERSYVLALAPKDGAKAREIKGMYLGIDAGGLSVRSWSGGILLGGEGHRTGENTEGGRYLRLQRAAAKYFPDYREEMRWSAQDCMTLDGVPYIGKYGHGRRNWYVATGFGKWGMTGSMTAAMLLSDQIAGRENPNAEVFSPQRILPRASAGNALNETGHAVRGLVGGKETQKPLRCTHLSCHLTWNPEEQTYDCPCHGSRFDAEGRLLDGPAQKNLP